MDRGKLGIALPKFNGQIDLDFFDYWTILNKPNFTYYRPSHYAPIDSIRNWIVQQALSDDCDYLLMLDTDQTFSSNMVEKLWDSFWAVPKHRFVGKDNYVDINPPGAISGKIYRRYPPYDPIMLFVDEDNKTEKIKYKRPTYEQQHEEGLLEVDATGTGCIMYNCEVFDEIPYPWFEQKAYEGGPGEDVYFCQKLKAAGYSIWVHRSVNIPHKVQLEANQALHDLYMKLGV
jgi:hypothetical protein